MEQEQLNNEIKELEERICVLEKDIKIRELSRDSFHVSPRLRRSKEERRECLKRKNEILRELEQEKLNKEMKELEERIIVLQKKIMEEDLYRDRYRLSSILRKLRQELQECLKRKNEILEQCPVLNLPKY